MGSVERHAIGFPGVKPIEDPRGGRPGRRNGAVPSPLDQLLGIGDPVGVTEHRVAGTLGIEVRHFRFKGAEPLDILLECLEGRFSLVGVAVVE